MPENAMVKRHFNGPAWARSTTLRKRLIQKGADLSGRYSGLSAPYPETVVEHPQLFDVSHTD